MHNNKMYARHKEKIQARRKAWRITNREKHLAQSRARALRASYKKLAAPIPRPAPANCEACGKAFTGTPRMDHDHKTNLFRGWLCHRCNSAIGLAGDTLEGVQKLVEYLNRRL